MVGFHACDAAVYESAINNRECLQPSVNDYDWLGHGIYFWENSLTRAQSYGEEIKRRGRISSVAVIGAVIDLGRCLNFVDPEYLELLPTAFEFLKADCDNAGIPLPQNKSVGGSSDLLLRCLDCAVIHKLHE